MLVSAPTQLETQEKRRSAGCASTRASPLITETWPKARDVLNAKDLEIQDPHAFALGACGVMKCV